MRVSAEVMIDRLNQHETDFEYGNAQDLADVCADCKIAAEMIGVLRTSKHTHKRRAQRLRKKLSEKNKRIEILTAEVERLSNLLLL